MILQYTPELVGESTGVGVKWEIQPLVQKLLTFLLYNMSISHTQSDIARRINNAINSRY
jgi:hypothetical protein